MTLSLSEFLLSIVLFFFLWIALDWLWSRWGERRGRRRLAKRYRECHVCGKVYAESSRVKISECPDCAALNSKHGHRRLA